MLVDIVSLWKNILESFQVSRVVLDCFQELITTGFVIINQDLSLELFLNDWVVQ